VRIRLQSMDYFFRNPKTWTAKEKRAYQRYTKWLSIDTKLLTSLSRDPQYQGKVVAVFHGKILAVGADYDKVISEVELLGGTKLRQQAYYQFFYPPNTKLIMPSRA